MQLAVWLFVSIPLADLPQIEPTVEAMQTAFENFTASPATNDFSFNPFEDKKATPYKFASLSLGGLRALGLMAIERGQGLVLQAW